MIIVLLSVSSTGLFGQEDIALADLIKARCTDRTELPYQQNIDFLRADARSLPLLEGLELRTETDQWDVDRQQLTARFKFNSRGEKAAVDGILSSMEDIYALKQQEYLAEQYIDIYKKIVDINFLQQEAVLIATMLRLSRDESRYLQNRIDNLQEVAIGDWLSVQEDIIKKTADSVEIEYRIATLLSSLQIEGNIDFGQLVTVEEIERYALGTESDSSSIEVTLAMSEERKAIYEYELEEAEGEKWLDFLQLQYQSDDRISFQDELSFSTSILLPSSSRNRTKKQEAALEMYEKKYDRMLAQDEQLRTLTTQKIELLDLIKSYGHVRQDVLTLQLDETYKTYLDSPVSSPRDLLDIRKVQLGFVERMQDMEKDIYKQFVDCLSLAIDVEKEGRNSSLISKATRK